MYRIDITLQNGFCANQPIMLDALIRLFMEYEGIEQNPIEFDQEIGIYKASCLLIPNEYTEKVQIIRSQINANSLKRLNTKSADRKIKIASGKFKHRQVPFKKMITKKVVAFFDGDYKQVDFLLKKHLASIGVKNNINGIVESVSISKEYGFSFYDKLLRPLPLAFAESKGFSGQIRPTRKLPPYFLNSDQEPCVCPDFQIEL